MTSVIIPAYNEAATIAGVVSAFRWSAKYVLAGIDSKTTDQTRELALKAGAIPIADAGYGKGQAVSFAMRVLDVLDADSTSIVFCDADITGISQHDVRWLISAPDNTMRILVPEPIGTPPPWSWEDSYHWVSGIRSVPRRMLRKVDFHGFLMETQLNRLAKERDMEVEFHKSLTAGSPWRLTAERMAAMRSDREWGRTNGVL